MVKRCCIKTCNVAYYGGISFHSFPSNQALKKKWLDVLPAGQEITKESVVCSLHFKPGDFCTVNSTQILKYNVVPSIFPVTCKVKLTPLTIDTTVRAGEQPRVVVPVPKIDPDLSVRTRLIFEPDPIEDNEISEIQETHSLAEDTDQPSEDLILLSNTAAPLRNAAVPLRNTPALLRNKLAALRKTPAPLNNEQAALHNTPAPLSNVEAPLSDTMGAEKPSADLLSDQAKQIDKLTNLLAQRDQTIADMKLEINDLMNYISECYWEVGFKATSKAQVPSKSVSNRNVFVVKREWSPDIDQPTSTVGEEVTSDVPQNPLLDVQNTSENGHETSVGTKRKLDSRDDRHSVSKARRT